MSLADEPQIRQVAVPLAELEAVADEELVRDREAHIANREVVDEPAVRALEERCDVQRRGIADRQRTHEVVHRQPGVDDRVAEHDVAPLDLGVQVLEEANPVARVLAVAGELDEVERVVDRERARQVADERDARLQRPDEERLAAGVVARELGAELADARADLVGVEEDLADALVQNVVDAQDAFARPKRAASRSKSRS